MVEQSSDALLVEDVRTLLLKAQETANGVEDPAIRALLLEQTRGVLSAIKYVIDARQPVAESHAADGSDSNGKNGHVALPVADANDQDAERRRFEQDGSLIKDHLPRALKTAEEHLQFPAFAGVARSDVLQMGYLSLKWTAMNFHPETHADFTQQLERRLQEDLSSLPAYQIAKQELKSPIPSEQQQSRRSRFTRWALEQKMTRGKSFDDLVLAVYHANLPLIEEAVPHASEKLRCPPEEVRQEFQYCFACCCWTYDPAQGDFVRFVTANLEKAAHNLEAATQREPDGHLKKDDEPSANGTPHETPQEDPVTEAPLQAEEGGTPAKDDAPRAEEEVPLEDKAAAEVPVQKPAPDAAPAEPSAAGTTPVPVAENPPAPMTAEDKTKTDEKNAEQLAKEKQERAFRAWAQQAYGITGSTMGEIYDRLSKQFEPLAMGVAGKTTIGKAKIDRATLRKRAIQQLRIAIPRFDPSGETRFDDFLRDFIARDLNQLVMKADRIEDPDDGKKKRKKL